MRTIKREGIQAEDHARTVPCDRHSGAPGKRGVVG